MVMYEGQKRPDLWNLLGWVLTGVVLLILAGLYVGLLVRWPVATWWVTSNFVAAALASWATGRNLRAELEAVRERLSTYNASETHAALAEVGPVTPAKGTVELYDQDADPLAFAASVGREHAAVKPPRMTGERDTEAQDRELSEIYGIEHDVVLDRPERPAVTLDGTVRVVKAEALAAGHGLHVSRGWGDDPWAPGCGCPLAVCGLVIPQWGCVQHDNGKTFRQAHRVDECPAYADDGCPRAECPHPDRCDTGCRWGEEANRWADAVRTEDDPYTGPRSVPGPRVSD